MPTKHSLHTGFVFIANFIGQACVHFSKVLFVNIFSRSLFCAQLQIIFVLPFSRTLWSDQLQVSSRVLTCTMVDVIVLGPGPQLRFIHSFFSRSFENLWYPLEWTINKNRHDLQYQYSLINIFCKLYGLPSADFTTSNLSEKNHWGECETWMTNLQIV